MKNNKNVINLFILSSYISTQLLGTIAHSGSIVDAFNTTVKKDFGSNNNVLSEEDLRLMVMEGALVAGGVAGVLTARRFGSVDNLTDKATRLLSEEKFIKSLVDDTNQKTKIDEINNKISSYAHKAVEERSGKLLLTSDTELLKAANYKSLLAKLDFSIQVSDYSKDIMKQYNIVTQSQLQEVINKIENVIANDGILFKEELYQDASDYAFKMSKPNFVKLSSLDLKIFYTSFARIPRLETPDILKVFYNYYSDIIKNSVEYSGEYKEAGARLNALYSQRNKLTSSATDTIKNINITKQIEEIEKEVKENRWKLIDAEKIRVAKILNVSPSDLLNNKSEYQIVLNELKTLKNKLFASDNEAIKWLDVRAKMFDDLNTQYTLKLAQKMNLGEIPKASSVESEEPKASSLHSMTLVQKQSFLKRMGVNGLKFLAVAGSVYTVADLGSRIYLWKEGKEAGFAPAVRILKGTCDRADTCEQAAAQLETTLNSLNALKASLSNAD